MKFHIKNELKEGTNNEFEIGYYEGKHSTKRWLLEDEDLRYMYSTIKSDEIHLWCDLDVTEENFPPPPPPPKKSKEERSSSRREDKEKKVEDTIEILKDKHKDKYTLHQYTMWARMVVNKLHQEL